LHAGGKSARKQGARKDELETEKKRKLAGGVAWSLTAEEKRALGFRRRRSKRDWHEPIMTEWQICRACSENQNDSGKNGTGHGKREPKTAAEKW
jgi:hypothetical protein